MSTDPDSTTASAEVSPANSSTEAEAPVGRDFINNLPPELLARILKKALALCWTADERQSESQVFLRVCRSFYQAYLVSEAAHECYIDSTKQATALAEKIQHTPATEFRVDRLILTYDHQQDNVEAYCEAVVACQGSLRQLTWHTYDEMDTWSRLLAGWPHLTRLDLAVSEIYLEDDYLASNPLTSWQLPTKLRSVTLEARDGSALLLLESIGRASSHTLVDITVRFNYQPITQALVESFAPVATLITRLTLLRDGPTVSSVRPLLASLPNLIFLELPVGFITSSVASRLLLADAFILQPLGKLRVLRLEHTRRGDLVNNLLVLLRGAKVPVLQVDRGWWDRKRRDQRMACEMEAAAKGIKLELMHC